VDLDVGEKSDYGCAKSHMLARLVLALFALLSAWTSATSSVEAVIEVTWLWGLVQREVRWGVVGLKGVRGWVGV
jgi:hypothetical protein